MDEKQKSTEGEDGFSQRQFHLCIDSGAVSRIRVRSGAGIRPRSRTDCHSSVIFPYSSIAAASSFSSVSDAVSCRYPSISVSISCTVSFCRRYPSRPCPCPFINLDSSCLISFSDRCSSTRSRPSFSLTGISCS
ncbi:hypothetical protein ACLOJK_016381 [Asimina triloba]